MQRHSKIYSRSSRPVRPALGLEPGTSFFLFTESSNIRCYAAVSARELKRAEGATHILIVSVQCRFFIVFRNYVHWEMLLELFSLSIHFFKYLLVDQFGLASALAESRPGMFPK
jgi:hypothetical protein